MMQTGMIRHKCPTCGEYFFAQSWEVDYIHRCVKADHVTKMTTKTDFEKIPNRINIKFDKGFFTNLGLNPYPKKRRKKEKEDSCYEDVNVETYIDLT